LVNKLLQEEERIYKATSNNRQADITNALVEKLTRQRFESPSDLATIRQLPAIKKNDPFYLLPHKFLEKYQLHPSYLEAECAFAQDKEHRDEYRPLAFYSHFAMSEAGLNVYSMSAGRDYILMTYNFMELSAEDDLNDTEPWNDNVDVTDSTFTETLKDLLRLHLVLVPEDDASMSFSNTSSDLLRLYRIPRMNRKMAFDNHERNYKRFRFLSHFYTLD